MTKYCRAVVLVAVVALATVASCGRDSASGLSRPCNIDVRADGQVYVADFHNVRVVMFDPKGEVQDAVGSRGFGPGELWGVGDVTTLPDGGFAVINQARASLDDLKTPRPQVKLFGPNGREVRSFSTMVGVDKTSLPTAVAVVPEGLAVTDIGNHRISIFSMDGLPKRVIERIQGGPPLVAPTGLRYRGERLWIAEGKKHRVRALSLEGAQLLNVGTEGSKDGQFLFPHAVDVSEEGWFVVADLGNYRIQRFSAQGDHLNTIVPSPANPDVRVQLNDIAVGPDGLIYAVDAKGDRVLVYSPKGELVRVLGG